MFYYLVHLTLSRFYIAKTFHSEPGIKVATQNSPSFWVSLIFGFFNQAACRTSLEPRPVLICHAVISGCQEQHF